MSFGCAIWHWPTQPGMMKIGQSALGRHCCIGARQSFKYEWMAFGMRIDKGKREHQQIYDLELEIYLTSTSRAIVSSTDIGVFSCILSRSYILCWFSTMEALFLGCCITSFSSGKLRLLFIASFSSGKLRQLELRVCVRYLSRLTVRIGAFSCDFRAEQMLIENCGLIQHFLEHFFFFEILLPFDRAQKESSNFTFQSYHSFQLLSPSLNLLFLLSLLLSLNLPPSPNLLLSQNLLYRWQCENPDFFSCSLFLLETLSILSPSDEDKAEILPKLCQILLSWMEFGLRLAYLLRRVSAVMRLVCSVPCQENQANMLLNNYAQSSKRAKRWLTLWRKRSTNRWAAHSPSTDNPFTSSNNFPIISARSSGYTFRVPSTLATMISPKGLTLQCQSLMQRPSPFFISALYCCSRVAKVYTHSLKVRVFLNYESGFQWDEAELMKVGVGWEEQYSVGWRCSGREGSEEDRPIFEQYYWYNSQDFGSLYATEFGLTRNGGCLGRLRLVFNGFFPSYKMSQIKTVPIGYFTKLQAVIPSSSFCLQLLHSPKESLRLDFQTPNNPKFIPNLFLPSSTIKHITMHVFQVAFYFSGIYYALFIERSVLLPFALVLALYLIASALLPGAKDLSIRRKIMNATWSHPTEGNITVRVPVRVDKVQKLLQSLPKENRASLTHFAIKGVGEILAAQPFLNGSLSLGKFLGYEGVDVSCLVDIGGGKDLAMVLVKGVDKLSVDQIAAYIRQKASKMKKSEGGDQHKSQMKPFRLVPACLVEFLIDLISFLANKLAIALPAFKIEKHAFGAACVTSLCSLNLEDVTAPFSGFTNCSLLLAANAVAKQPVVQGDKVVIGEVMNSNFRVDHRYIDGGNCTKLVSVYRDVFQNPEKYMSKSTKAQKQE